MIPRRKQRDFAPIRSLMAQVFKNLEGRAGKDSLELEGIWRDLVGEELSSLARIARVNERTVEIQAASSSVLAEIEQFYRDRLLARLGEAGIAGIDRAVFRLADR